ncbi:Fructose-bisphosphate aldolase, class-I [Parasponia andersonii]|uniref:Fructose-bisphosphate aldolase n=1 Tax=Parasponia andersonii TaxID=3476 RepID=A0A2P5DE82_PARAD|nr:Fructose-bisphosphate aldolase, class-I [Parasponia andersonii]
MVDVLVDQNIVPGSGFPWLVRTTSHDAKVVHSLLLNTNKEPVLQNVVSIPNGPSALAVKEAAWGLARYAAISQDNGLVPIVEPEILLGGEHGIDKKFEVAQKAWAEAFFYLAENNVTFEGILLKPSMVTPGADGRDKATPEQVADYSQTPQAKNTKSLFFFKAIHIRNTDQKQQEDWRRKIALLSQESLIRGYTELEHNEPLYNTCLKKWGGRPKNVKKTRDALLVRVKANSPAQLGKYTGDGEPEESNQEMFVKGFVY